MKSSTGVGVPKIPEDCGGSAWIFFILDKQGPKISF